MKRLFIISSALILCVSGASAQTLYEFQGKLKTVDTSAHTFTVQSGKRVYVFNVTPKTKIMRKFKPVGLREATLGEEIRGTFTLSPDRKGIALTVNLGHLGTTPGAKGDFPYGIPVPNKPGFVTSPYTSGYVDVRGFPSGTQVKDPYTGKIFLVP